MRNESYIVVWFETKSTLSPRRGILFRPRTWVKLNGKRKNKKHTKPAETMAMYDAQILKRASTFVMITMSIACARRMTPAADAPPGTAFRRHFEIPVNRAWIQGDSFLTFLACADHLRFGVGRPAWRANLAFRPASIAWRALLCAACAMFGCKQILAILDQKSGRFVPHSFRDWLMVERVYRA